MMHEEFDDLQISLTAYNYGPTRVREMLKRRDQLPGQYAQKVLSIYKKFLEMKPPDLSGVRISVQQDLSVAMTDETRVVLALL
jgi:hypothetical protein